MKRTLFLTLALLLLAGSGRAQTDQKSQALINRYSQTTGLNQTLQLGNLRIEMHIAAAGSNIPMSLTKSATKGCFRFEMNIPGQGDVLMVTNGQQGWVATKNAPVMELPKETIDQMALQGDVSNSMGIDTTNFIYTYSGATEGIEWIEGQEKGQQGKILSLGFSAKTGLLAWLRTEGIEMEVKEYKKFNNILLPTRLSTTLPGNQNAVIRIKNIEFGIPLEARIFEKPEPLK